LNAGAIFNNNGFGLITGSYQYHFFESLGLEAAAGGFGFQTNDDDKLYFYQASASFSPIYGKISWFTWAVLNFDLYAIGGAGVVRYTGLADGTSFMGNVGLGSRVFINEFLSAKIEFRDYIYDRTLVNDSEIRHNYALTAGISILIPFEQDL
jgi:outer membrane beta-barrel protein